MSACSGASSCLSGSLAIPTGAAFDILYKKSTGTSTVDTIADGINGRSWVGQLESGAKWTRDTTEKSPNAVGYYAGGSYGNVEYLDAGGDNLSASFQGPTSYSFCTYSKMDAPSGSHAYLFCMREKDAGTAAQYLAMWFFWTGTNWYLRFGGSVGTVSADLGAGASNAPPFSGWNSWAVSNSAGVCTLYKNGVALTTLTHSPSTFPAVSGSPAMNRFYSARSLNTDSWRGWKGRDSGYLAALSAGDMLTWHNATLAEYP